MRKGTVLLIEDRADDEALTTHALRRAGISNPVKTITNGAAALAWLAAQDDTSEMPILVLLELRLPKVGGLTVLRELRAHRRTKRIPVIVWTASEDPDEMVESFRAGASGCLHKPVDGVEFAEIVRQIGLFWIVEASSSSAGSTAVPTPR